MMEPRRAPEYTLDIFADPTYAKEIVKAILHVIFFHRYFIPITPSTRDIFDLTLPAIDDLDLETLIEQRANSLVRAMQSAGTNGTKGKGVLVVSFAEKKRKKTYFFGKADEEVCWETWVLEVTTAVPRNEDEKKKVYNAMVSSLLKNSQKIIHIVNRDKDHIPPITTTETNPFPYQIVVNPPRNGNDTIGIGPRMGIF